MTDWRQQKAAVLKNAKRVVMKVGSAVLTGEQGLDLRVVNRLADQISALHDAGRDIILVSSGAVAAGRKVVANCLACRETSGLPATQAVSAIGQSRLMHEYDEAFGRYGKTTAQILLTKDDFQSRQRFLNARNTIGSLLAWRAIPIINENDTVAVAELKFGDNDFLASLVLSLVEADLFVNLTSAQGVYDQNPDTTPEAKPLAYIDHIAELRPEKMCAGKTSVGSGGMLSKLMAARRAAQLAVPTLIVSGKEPYGLERAFAGEDFGTWISPAAEPMSRRKFWLAYHSVPEGELWVDVGAVTALREKGRSLLPAGITRVEGRFGKGALVRILDFEGQTIGVGLSNYAAKELRQVMGLKSAQIEGILGGGAYPEAIHRDNLVLDPAL